VLGKRSAQRGLFEADTQYLEFVGQRTFYGYLASQRHELFRDEDFAALYSRHRGRPSVPPSLLATALVLQTYDGVSDEEAKQRADYDVVPAVPGRGGRQSHPAGGKLRCRNR